jgi:hypothetical protein
VRRSARSRTESRRSAPPSAGAGTAPTLTRSGGG